MVEHWVPPWLDSRSEEHAMIEHVTYLNNAGQAPLSESVKAAGQLVLQRAPWDAHDDSSEDQAKIRVLFSSLINADPQRIAIMPSTAFAITLAANNIQRKQTTRSKILVLQDQMCSAVYPWEWLCQESPQISLDIVQYPKRSWTEAVLERLDENVLVACLPQIHWSDGSLLDLKLIGAACRKFNVHLIVDATQSIGILPFDVNEIMPTLVACSVHKWLRAPHGMSLVYLSQNVQHEWQPLDQHGRSRAIAIDHGSSWDASKNEMGPDGYPADFCRDARKFDSGGKPNPILMPMLRTSLEEVVQLNVAEAQEHLKNLTQPIVKWARENGFGFTPGNHAGHLIGIRPSPENPLTPSRMIEIVKELQAEGIFIAVRCGAFRISPYVDTTTQDIERLLDALDRLCGRYTLE